tara:strand:- start:554 stop:1090 length:537 start_codon:yes stop_codon:yes gene_type:complete
MTSQLRVDKILPVDGAPTNGGGGIIQCVSTTKTDTFAEDVATASFSGDAISLSITPKFSTSKILLMCNMSLAMEYSVPRMGFAFFRGGSVITGAIGDAASTRERVTTLVTLTGNTYPTSASANHLDSPSSTSAVTYSVRLFNGDTATRFLYLNRTHTDTDAARFARCASTMTAMEVSA